MLKRVEARVERCAIFLEKRKGSARDDRAAVDRLGHPMHGCADPAGIRRERIFDGPRSAKGRLARAIGQDDLVLLWPQGQIRRVDIVEPGKCRHEGGRQEMHPTEQEHDIRIRRFHRIEHAGVEP